ncbi:hypothetical protein ScPMuIL_015671 [Solemya velum]
MNSVWKELFVEFSHMIITSLLDRTLTACDVDMDVLNKLKSAVSSALPGNPLSREFDLTNQVGSCGVGLLWKIYNGIKRSTKQEVAIFVLEKKLLERYSRRDQESRESLAFATEPVFASLANVLGCHDNLPNPLPKDLQEYKLYDVEIKYGLLQVSNGSTSILQKDAKLLHNGICPESVIINKSGSWKLAGFDFCCLNCSPQDSNPSFEFKEWDPELPPVCQPNLDYLAPEYAITMSCSLSSDMFSMGVLICTIFNNGKPLYECKNQLSLFRKYTEELRKFRTSLIGSVPDEVKDYVKLLLNTEPSVRPDPDQLSKLSFFEDVGSMTLQYMDNLFQQDNLQKSKFFKGLPQIIAKMPKRVNIQRILPAMLKECVNADMIPFILPNILLLAEQSSNAEYVCDILPVIKPFFQIKEPVQILLIFLQNMDLLLSKTPQADIKNYVLPMIYRALEAESPQIQELCLDIIPAVAELIEYQALKTSILTRVKKLCLSTSTLAIRVSCLVCLGKLLEFMDKWSVLDDVLPILPQIPSREPAVLMSILGIYQVTLTLPKLGITKDILATKVIPFMIALSIDHNLNLQQFNAYISVVKEMIQRVEAEHRTKLEQLGQMQQEHKTLEITKMTGQDDDKLITGIEDKKSQSMMDKFLGGFGMAKLLGEGNKLGVQRGSSPVPGNCTESKPEVRPAGQPAKVSLTLEEKQHLAKEQENQVRYKNQVPLKVSTNNKPTAIRNTSSPNKSNVKDLTSSLMTANVMGLQTSASKSSGSLNQSKMAAPMSVAPSGIHSNMSTRLAFGEPNYSSNTQAQNVDLSAFDSLLPSSKQPQQSLKQMAQAKPQQTSQFSPALVRPMGNQSMVNQQMAGSSMGMMGNMGYGQNMMGMPRTSGNFGYGAQGPGMNYNQGMNNQTSMGMFQAQQMGQNIAPQQQQQQQHLQPTVLKPPPNSSASNDLADIFG